MRLKYVQHSYPASLFPLLTALFSPPPPCPFHPFLRGPAFTQWTLPPPHQTTLLSLRLPLPLQINSPQRRNSPMACQFATPPPGLSNASACRHIRSRITVVCAEVRQCAMLVSISIVLKLQISASALN